MEICYSSNRKHRKQQYFQEVMIKQLVSLCKKKKYKPQIEPHAINKKKYEIIQKPKDKRQNYNIYGKN